MQLGVRLSLFSVRCYNEPPKPADLEVNMDFGLSEEHVMVQDLVSDFAQREIAPKARENDINEYWDKDIVKRMGELGLLGAPIPEEYGGSGMDYHSLAIICEELERAETAFRVVMSVHVALNSLTLLQWGNEDQKQRYLIPQARGEKLATFALTEPGHGSDAANIETTARREGDYYVLNGQKTWISLADKADHFLLFATLDRSKGYKGITAFILERGFEGLSTSTIHGKLGVRAGNTGQIFLDNVRVPIENRLGEEGEGFKIAMSAIDQGRLTVAAGAVGLARACLEASLKYCHEREAFGQEIGKFQLVQQMIANMQLGIDTAKLLVHRAAWLKNHGIRSTRETSMAKWYACNVALKAAEDAIEIHGANGYSNEFPVERYWRNARGAVIYEGTREIHTLIQAEYALGYRKDHPLRCPQPPVKGYDPSSFPSRHL